MVIKNFFLSFLFGFGVLIAFTPFLSHAQSSDMTKQLQTAGNEVGGNFASQTDPRITAANIIKSALTFIGFLVVVLIIYAGVLYTISGGESEKKQKALDTIKAAVIGLVIILTAYAITIFVINTIQGKSSGSSNISSPNGLQPPSSNSF